MILALIFTHREYYGFLGGLVCDSCGYLYFVDILTYIGNINWLQDAGTGGAKMLTSYWTLLRNHIHMTFRVRVSINRKLFKLTTQFNVLTAQACETTATNFCLLKSFLSRGAHLCFRLAVYLTTRWRPNTLCTFVHMFVTVRGILSVWASSLEFIKTHLCSH